jgi:hypothetical protein
MIDPAPTIRKGRQPNPIRVGYSFALILSLLGLVVCVVSSLAVPVTAGTSYTCAKGDRPVTIPMNPSEVERRQAEVVAISDFNSGSQAVTNIDLTLRASNDRRHYTVVGGELLDGNKPLGAFSVNWPLRGTRLDPSSIIPAPPPNAKLRLCLRES